MIYLDHAATTPLAAEVAQAMAPWVAAGAVGNASSLHAAGRRARAAVEDARDQVAAALGVPALDVVFTSGGTESDNQAVAGLALGARAAGRPGGVVTTAIEHHAVLETAEALRDHDGLPVHVVEVGADGVVDPDRLLDVVDAATAAGEGPAVVSVMAANNELGSLQPLAAIGPALADRGIALHTDAVQAFGKVALDLSAWQPTALTITAHKVGGPTGIGALVLRRDAAVRPVQHGGGQERGIRSGTLPVAAIVGLGAAADLAAARLPGMAEVAALRDALEDELLARLPDATVNGDLARRLPTHLHLGIGGVDAEALLLQLDREGVACSTGSACQSGAAQRSHVLDAIGARADAAHLRFSLGHETTADDVRRAAGIVVAAVGRQGAGGGWTS